MQNFRCQNNFPFLTQMAFMTHIPLMVCVHEQSSKKPRACTQAKRTREALCILPPLPCHVICSSLITSSFSGLPIIISGPPKAEEQARSTPATRKIFPRVYQLRRAGRDIEKCSAVRLFHWRCLHGKKCMHRIMIRLTSP